MIKKCVRINVVKVNGTPSLKVETVYATSKRELRCMMLDNELFFTREKANEAIFSPQVALKIPPISVESKLKALERIKTLFDRWENENLELRENVMLTLSEYYKKGGISQEKYRQIVGLIHSV